MFGFSRLLAATIALGTLVPAPGRGQEGAASPEGRDFPASLPELRARLDAPAVAALSPRNASYAIDVRLDTVSHELTGHELIRYRNITTHPMRDVQLHLYLNAFKNLKTTFMRESGGQLRGDRYKSGRWGSTDIEEIRLAGGDGLDKGMAFIRPDDGNPDDETVVLVPLPVPVGPGETLELEVGFKARLPKVFARTGYAGTFHMVGQWFPKVGVFEEPRGGGAATWNCHQFHAATEFYGDYGVYDVRILADPAAVVGATGRLLETTTTAGGLRIHHYRAEDVHDFAFTADPDFKEARERWRDVEIRLLYQPEHDALVKLHMGAARQALEFFDRAYGPYPYGTLTLVDPGPGAGGAAGMEYPTLITVGASWYSVQDRLLGWLLKVRGTELTIVHEFGHQYWYGLVGSNEFEEAWLDEGFNSYSETRALAQPVAELLGGAVRLSDLGLHRASYIGVPKEGPVLQKAWTYPSYMGYGVAAYSKSAVVLRTLDNILGEDVMAAVLRRYFETWRFRHPRSEDFFQIASEVSGTDLEPYWSQFVRRDLAVDYAVRWVKCRREKDQAGLYDREGKRVELTAEELDKAEKKEAARSSGAKSDGEGKDRTYRTQVLLERLEEGVLPVDYEVLFEDGHVEKGVWDGQARALRLELVRPSRVARAVVDPGRKLLLDICWANNGKVPGAGAPFEMNQDREPPRKGPAKAKEVAGKKELQSSRDAARWFLEAIAASASVAGSVFALFL